MKHKIFIFSFIGAALIFSSCGKQTPISPELTQDYPTIPLAKENISANEATSLFLPVRDPIGDHTGRIDVVSMSMNFDNVTGDYIIALRADRANPFLGSFRININLFNQDVGTTNPNPSLFSDVLNDFGLTTPTTRIMLTGTNPVLLAWKAGDRVFTNSLEGTGNPDGITLFRSAVNDRPEFGFLTDEDVIAFENLAQPARVRERVFMGQ